MKKSLSCEAALNLVSKVQNIKAEISQMEKLPINQWEFDQDIIQ